MVDTVVSCHITPQLFPNPTRSIPIHPDPSRDPSTRRAPPAMRAVGRRLPGSARRMRGPAPSSLPSFRPPSRCARVRIPAPRPARRRLRPRSAPSPRRGTAGGGREGAGGWRKGRLRAGLEGKLGWAVPGPVAGRGSARRPRGTRVGFVCGEGAAVELPRARLPVFPQPPALVVSADEGDHHEPGEAGQAAGPSAHRGKGGCPCRPHIGFGTMCAGSGCGERP